MTRKADEARIVEQLTAFFNASGVPYQCAAVVHNVIRAEAFRLINEPGVTARQWPVMRDTAKAVHDARLAAWIKDMK